MRKITHTQYHPTRNQPATLQTMANEPIPQHLLVDVPEELTVVDAFVVFKAIDSDGHPAWLTRQTGNLNKMEILGLLTASREHLLLEEVAHIQGWNIDGEEPT